MSGKLILASNRLQIIKGTRTAFDTDAPGVRLYPDGELVITTQPIEFPNLWSGYIYTTFAVTSPVTGITTRGCTTYLSPVEQEWGPSEPSPRNLPDIVLGAVPTGTDYLEVWLNMDHTVEPAPVLGSLPVITMLKKNEEVKLEGGAIQLESYSGIRRMVEFLVVGGNAVMRRTQSTFDGGTNISRATPPVSSFSANSQYFYSGTNAPNNSGKFAALGALIEKKTSKTNNLYPNSSQACSMSTSLSYYSKWEGTIRIVPGSYSAG